MHNEDFISDMQKFTAVCAVGASALRGQGAGVLGKVQKDLGSIELSRLSTVKNQDDLSNWLDKKTDELVDHHNMRWGAARKALNLFLRDCLYNKYLSEQYRLDFLDEWLEIPLDSVVARQLKKDAGRGQLPLWNGLRKLKREDSRKFQNYARQLAQRKNLSPVHLDAGLWVNNRLSDR